MVKRKSQNRLIEMDAAALFNKWYLGSLDSSVPCTGIRLRGPKNLNQLDNPTNLPDSKNLCDIPGWNLERCAAARRKLSTWDIDFEWTQAQHEIGARFGARVCKKQKNGIYDTKICKSKPYLEPSVAGKAAGAK